MFVLKITNMIGRGYFSYCRKDLHWDGRKWIMELTFNV